MSIPATAPSTLPAIAGLRSHQQMAMDCALCAHPLEASDRRLGEVRHRDLLFQLWACAPNCQAPGPNFPTS
ncbi:hypothetical protein ACWEQO_23070 [Streptomyces sp. NPDC004051]